MSQQYKSGETLEVSYDTIVVQAEQITTISPNPILISGGITLTGGSSPLTTTSLTIAQGGSLTLPTVVSATQPPLVITNSAQYQAFLSTTGAYVGSNVILMNLMKIDNLVYASFAPNTVGALTATATTGLLTFPDGSIPEAFRPVMAQLNLPCILTSNSIYEAGFLQLDNAGGGSYMTQIGFTAGQPIVLSVVTAVWQTANI